MKIVIGPAVNQWLASLIAFMFCAVISSTVGFEPVPFFGGLLSLIVLLRLVQFILGEIMYDVIVIAMIIAYQTKPTRESFNGRPLREMQAAQKKLKEYANPSTPPASTSFWETLIEKGKKVVQDVVTNVADANVSLHYATWSTLTTGHLGGNCVSGLSFLPGSTSLRASSTPSHLLTP